MRSLMKHVLLLGNQGGGIDLTDGLVSAWLLNETSNPREDSVSTHDFTTGTVARVNGPSLSVPYAVELNWQNRNGLYTASDPVALRAGNRDFSIAVWVKFYSFPSAVAVMSKQTGATAYDWMLNVPLNSDGKSFPMSFSVYGMSDGVRSAPCIIGRWYFVAAGFIAATKQLWIRRDDEDRVVVTRTGDPQTSTQRVFIGNSKSTFCDGAVAAPLFYAKYLDDAHLDALYNEGQGIQYPFSIAPTPGIRITSPTPYTSFDSDGAITVTGVVAGVGSVDLEGRFNGGTWEPLASGVAGAFSGELTGQSAGIGTLEIRTTDEAYSDSVSEIDYGDTFSLVSTQTLITEPSGLQRWLGRPRLCDLGDGVWGMLYRQATNHGNDSGNLWHLCFSEDEGATWTDDDTFTDGDPCVGAPFGVHAGSLSATDGLLIKTPGGDLLVLLNERTGYGTAQYRSEDGGKTWADEGEILSDSTLMLHESFTIVGSDIYVAARYDAGADGTHPHRAQIYKSSDDGGTWAKVADVDNTLDCDEMGLVWTGGTDLVLTMRNTWDGTASQYNSSDLGVTWGTRLNIGTMVGYLHRPVMQMITEGVLHYGRDAHPSVGHRTVVYLSPDGGAKWRKRFYPDTTAYEDAGYCDVLRRTDGKFYMLSYAGTTTIADIMEYIFELS